MEGMWWEFAKAYEASTKWTCWPGHGALVRKAMNSAQRFFLPKGVDLSVGKEYHDVADLLRLPFDTVAVMSETETKGEWEFANGHRLRTITLAISAERAGDPAFGAFPIDRWPAGETPWILLIPLVRFARKDSPWIPSGAAVFVTKVESGDRLTLKMYAADTPFTSQWLLAGSTPEDLIKEASHDLKCVVELCLLLGLHNVRRVHKPAPKFAAKKRERSGKAPLFDYHILEVDGDLWERSADVERSTGAGVRSHLRRGHVRRLADSRRVWVRACYVHGAVPGFASKDYALSA
jgi:hypothetical protein